METAPTDSTTDDERDPRMARAALAGGRLRTLLLELWQRTRLDWGFVSDRLAQTFRKESWLGGRDRRFVAETLYGLVRQLRRLDAAIAIGSRRGSAPRDDQRLVAYLLLDGQITVADAGRALPGLDWAAVAAIDARIARERDPVQRLALSGSLPDWLAARFHADWGPRAPALVRALNHRAPMTIRANRLRTTREGLIAALAARGLTAHAGAFADDAVIVDSRTNLFALPELAAGWFEAQDQGSQLLVELLGDRPGPAVATGYGDVVVDLCAGAGGKTLAIAARMGNRGRVIATDPDTGKLDELRRRARRAGVTTVEPIHLPDGAWPDALERHRDRVARVLVDAPCSGVGALRRNPEARWRLREADLADFGKRQRMIATRAATLLAPGGRLVYATCTLTSVENQAVVADVMAATGLVRVPLADVLGDRAANLASDDGRDFTATPDRHDTDGFFAAVLERPV